MTVALWRLRSPPYNAIHGRALASMTIPRQAFLACFYTALPLASATASSCRLTLSAGLSDRWTWAMTKRKPRLTWRAVSMKFCFLPRCKRRIMEGSGRPTHCGALSIPAIRTEALSGPRSLEEE